MADFGTSRVMTPSRPLVHETAFDGGVDGQSIAALTVTMTKGVGTLLWMAPELFVSGTKYGPEVDVYVWRWPRLCAPREGRWAEEILSAVF